MPIQVNSAALEVVLEVAERQIVLDIEKPLNSSQDRLNFSELQASVFMLRKSLEKEV